MCTYRTRSDGMHDSIDMIEFRVVDLETLDVDENAKTVWAQSLEGGVELALGLVLIRSGAKQDFRAKVYSQHPGQPVNMVRLYTKVADRKPNEISDA